ncbi:hypothetical protein J8L98_16305 [Pseudoalteromonas sp. MMG013]|uniref:hypothetical protein n=1 Tax=Pseudoalteromonas sp. MMG013 TaxID=2822687 RepID=UPI001B387C9E|nr:hypothetical protein [Pseudoalteromonas sp. MMG013]MBQ4863251.1 hypothetical protein [Pseudoalteromonas sp. MMG013]
MSPVWADETVSFLDKLKVHYESTRTITKFSLNYHFLNKQYRSLDYWDHQAPNRILSVRMVEVDLDKKHFYDNDILYTAGGQILDRAQFQNDTHSYYYEKNGNYLGKRYFNEGLDNFDNFIHYNNLNVDFLAIRPLLDESDVKSNITIYQNKSDNTITLTHKNNLGHTVDYYFSDSKLNLLKIHNKTRQAIFTYGDYQTTRGLTFARLVKKYYNGAKEPAYISFNDKFAIIDRVDASKLKLPEGYGPEIQPSDGILVATEIAQNLYVVTDSGGWRNSVLKVNGDKIMAFGAAGYPEQATKTIQLIAEKFPEKAISAIYVTHAQEADIGGLAVYAEHGIEIFADEYSISAIKAFPNFANSIDTFKFRIIENEQKIDGAHFYVLESLHAKRQSFVHFEQEGIIFQADFLNIAFDNTIPNVIPSYTRTFIDFIRSKKLKFHRIVGNYQNNNITVDVVNKTYDASM